MRLNLFALLLLLPVLHSSGNAQVADSTEKHALIQHERDRTAALRASSLSSVASTGIDVSYYFLRLTLATSPELLSGIVEIRAATLSDSLSSVRLDLMNTMTVDSVTSGGVVVPFSQDSTSVSIILEHTYHRTETINLQIAYHGVPTATGFGSFYFSTHNSSPWIWSLSEPYGARDWWPCKDHPADKADSADIWVTCDQALKVGSNGTLVAIVDNGDGTHTYKWSERYPIASYLISIAAGNFSEKTYWFHYATADSMPVLNYVLSDVLPNVTSQLDKVDSMLHIFSDLYGLYPFVREKYGHSSMGAGGAMEHQTMTSTTNFNEYTLAHELAHQWFGDMITCRTWRDLWLNEGFATYSEALYSERRYGADSYTNYLQSLFANAKKASGPLRPTDTTDVSTLFSTNNVYDKGAAVLHMLRHVLGDTVFFDALKAYAATPALRYSTASTDDFRHVCETTSGTSLQWFFDEWTDGEGYPVFTYDWSAAPGSTGWIVSVQLAQANGGGGTTAFVMPLDVVVKGFSQRMTSVISSTGGSETFFIPVTFRPVSVQLDPDKWVLCTVTDTVNTTIPSDFHVFQNYPNPFNPGTAIDYELPHQSHVSVVVYNLLGAEVRRLQDDLQSAGQHEVFWDGRMSSGNLAPTGIYFCRVKAGTQEKQIKMMLIR